MIVLIVNLTQSLGKRVSSRSNCPVEIILITLIAVGKLGPLWPVPFSRQEILVSIRVEKKKNKT